MYRSHEDAVKTAVADWGRAQFRRRRRLPATPSSKCWTKWFKRTSSISTAGHAHVDTADAPGIERPNLDFGSRQRSDIVFPADLDGNEWEHAPLVFMNGCGTVGFSPSAPSEFVTKFIHGRLASAVIGTEVTVWEVLAAEAGRDFLREFLNNQSAGEALLRVRRLLLAKYNPLGLVYTLYGSASLRLATT